MTLEQTAKLVGTSKQTIQRYETGVISNIPSDRIESLAKVLKTTPAYLMGWSDEPSMPGYSAAKDPAASEDLDQLLTIAYGLDDAEMKQLINYGQFLLSQKEN